MMEKLKHLDAKTIELAGIAASIAGGCRPCSIIASKKLLKLGAQLKRLKKLWN
jgi:AhpD family alkylhydroperoxidase